MCLTCTCLLTNVYLDVVHDEVFGAVLGTEGRNIHSIYMYMYTVTYKMVAVRRARVVRPQCTKKEKRPTGR
jgi:hypothetical protein